MSAKFSPGVQIAFGLAAFEARYLDNKFIDTEHLFLGLCKIEDVLVVGKAIVPEMEEEDWQRAEQEISAFREMLAQKKIDPKRARRRMRVLIMEADFEKGEFSGHRTDRARDAFALAQEIAQQDGREEVVLSDLFLAVLQQPSPLLDTLLAEFGVKRESFHDTVDDSYKTIHFEDKKEETEQAHSKTPLLDQLGRDLTRLAREGKLASCIGRNEEIKAVARILLQKQKNNPLLVGDAGVGKTAVVEGLAQRVVRPEAPEKLKHLRIVELNMASLVAGTKYRGEFEERLENVLKEASSDPHLVLFIDEIHTVIGAGAGNGALDAANILKPALARGEIRCIGATTTDEYHKYLEQDQALVRRFQVVWVEEPTRSEAIRILEGLRPSFEEHYGVRIPDQVLTCAVDLSLRHLPNFRLPDKAIDLLDQACSQKALQSFSIRSRKEGGTILEVTHEDVAKVVAARSRIPFELLAEDEAKRFLRMEKELKKRVIGQDHVISELAETLRTARAGLRNEKKPLGVFLFLGPTGTGKTELAKALAEFLFFDENKLIAFDMSEYQERHSIARLIGAPPGYVGYEEEGQLTGKVRNNPCAVVLFDEIEKAHPDIFNLLLQVLDEGRLTDGRGRTTSFTETIIIFTSNLGASAADAHIGFAPGNSITLSLLKAPNKNRVLEAAQSFFRPEFLNRIDKKLVFRPLGKQVAAQIVREKFLLELNSKLAAKGVRLNLSEEAMRLIVEEGYSEAYGARELRRTFERLIAEPLARMMLEEKLSPGEVLVRTLEGKLRFERNSF